MIHPTAIIHPGARLAADVRAGPFAVVEDGVELGAGVVLAAHVIIRRGAILGRGVKVDSLAVVGGDPQDLHFDPATPSGVRIGDGAVLREGVTVHRATRAGGCTEIGPGALLMGHSHVGHDGCVGARVVLGNGVLLAGHVTMGDDTFAGGGAVFHQHVRVGPGAMISGNARISLDVPPYTLVSERNEVHGFNVIGLKRRGCDAATLAELKRLFRAVYAGGDPRKNAAAQSPPSASAMGQIFLAFFADSKRGFARPLPAGEKASAPAEEAARAGNPPGEI